MASLTQTEMNELLDKCTSAGGKANQYLQLLGIQPTRRFGRQVFQGVIGDFYAATSIEVDILSKRYKSRLLLRAAVNERRETSERVAAPIVHRFGLKLWGEAAQSRPGGLIYTVPQDRERILLCTFCYIVHRACMKSHREKSEPGSSSEESDFIPDNEKLTRRSTAVVRGSLEGREESRPQANRQFEQTRPIVYSISSESSVASNPEDIANKTCEVIHSPTFFRAPEAHMMSMPRPTASPGRRLRIEPVEIGDKVPLESRQHRTESNRSQSSDTTQTRPTTPDDTQVTQPQAGQDIRKRTASTNGEFIGATFASRLCKRDGSGRRVKRRDTSWGASRFSDPNFNHDICRDINEPHDISISGSPVQMMVGAPVNLQPIDVGDTRGSAEAEVPHPIQPEQAPAELLPRSIPSPGTRPSLIVKLKLKFVPADQVDQETAQGDIEPIIGDIPEHIRADVEESITEDGAGGLTECGIDVTVQHDMADMDVEENVGDIVEDVARVGAHDIAEQQRETVIAENIASDRFSLTERLLQLRSVGPNELPTKAIKDITQLAERLLVTDKTHLQEVLGAKLSFYERALNAWIELVKILGDFQDKSGFSNVDVSLADHLATLDEQRLLGVASALYGGAKALQQWRTNCSNNSLDMDRFSTDVTHILTHMSHLLDRLGEKGTERLIAGIISRFHSGVFEWFKTPGASRK